MRPPPVRPQPTFPIRLRPAPLPIFPSTSVTPPPGNPSSNRLLLSGNEGNRTAPRNTPVLPCVIPLPAGAVLNDPERRAVRAAVALADIGEERAIDPIRAMAESHPNPQLRESAEKWLVKFDKAQEQKNTE